MAVGRPTRLTKTPPEKAPKSALSRESNYCMVTKALRVLFYPMVVLVILLRTGKIRVGEIALQGKVPIPRETQRVSKEAQRSKG